MNEFFKLVHKLAVDHPKLSGAEIIAIIKLVCGVTSAVCPLVTEMDQELHDELLKFVENSRNEPSA